jgi:hypothetical protein
VAYDRRAQQPEERALGRLERKLEVAAAIHHERWDTDSRREVEGVDLLLPDAAREAAPEEDDRLEAVSIALIITPVLAPRMTP